MCYPAEAGYIILVGNKTLNLPILFSVLKVRNPLNL